jgi:glycosyltransferase involved in cell wall biosynthesis
MRFLAVIHDSNKYGASRSFIELIIGLKDMHVDCHVVVPSDGPLIEELDILGVTYSFIPFKMWLSKVPVNWKRVIRSIYNLLVSFWIAYLARSMKADLIYTNTIMTPVGAIAAKIIRKPHVWQIREFAQEDFNLTFDLGLKVSHKLIDWLSYRVVLVSNALRDKYVKHISSEKLIVVYNPVDIGVVQSETDSSNNLLQRTNYDSLLIIVGLVHSAKGQLDAVYALSELIKQNYLIKLIIVGNGDGNYISSLNRVIREKGIDTHVKFTGYVDNPRFLIQSADIMLVCSKSEAFGRVTVEGMISSKPIIGARAGATPELIIDGFNGLLYDSGNYHDLACKIKRLIENPDRAKEMGVNGKLWAREKFSREKCVNQIFNIFEQARN